MANARDASEIDLEEGGDVSRGASGGDHVVAREAADLRHRLDAVSGPRLGRWAGWDGATGRVHARSGSCSGRQADGRRGCAGFEVLEDVALGDAARDAGALERGELDAVFRGDFPDERRGFGAEAFLEGAAVGLRGTA